MDDVTIPIPVEPPAPEVFAELERILADSRFAGSPSLIRFLRFAVTETLAGRTADLREGPLGLSVFERGRDFDPRIDPIVRVQARKLRARLQEYYENQGATHPVRIDLPKGTYIPRFILAAAPPSLPEPPAPPPPLRRRRWLPLTAALAGVLLLAAVVWLRTPRTPAVTTFVLNRLTYETGSTMWPALSRDGKLLAYASDRGKGNLNIWLQPLHGGTPVQVTHTESPALSPDFSPDGLSIVFRTRHAGGGIATVSVFGGEERRIAGQGWMPRFSPDGAWVAYQGSGTPYIVPAAGGPSRPVAPDGAVELRGGPLWTPDGRQLVSSGCPRSTNPGSGPFDWYTVPAAGGTPVSAGFRRQLLAQGLPDLIEDAAPADWLPGNGAIVFTMRRGTALNLWKAPFDLRTLRVSGPIVQLTSGSSFETPRAAPSGQIVSYSEDRRTYLYTLRIDNTGRASGTPEQLIEDSSLNPRSARPRLSASGKEVAYVSSRSGSQQIVLRNLATGQETASAQSARQDLPLLAGDSTFFVYQNAGTQLLSIAGQAAETVGSLHDWSPDGRFLLYEPPEKNVLILWDRTTNQRLRWLTYPPGSLAHASLSADHHWIALTLTDPGGGYLAPLTPAPVTRDHLTLAVADPQVSSVYWGAAGNRLYYFSYVDDHNCLWSQPLQPGTGKPAGPPAAVYHFHSNRLTPWSDAAVITAGRLILPLTELHSDIWMAAPAPGLR